LTISTNVARIRSVSEPASDSENVCPVCRSTSAPLVFVKNGYPMHRCGACELVFSAQPPGNDRLEELYSAEYFTQGGAGYPDYIGDERTHRRQARSYLRTIGKLGARGTLLDIGCAAGFFLDEARRHGWNVRGCELSSFAQAYAHNTLGLDVTRAGFLDDEFSPPPHSFDIITLFNVLEHLRQPPLVAAKLFGLLRPGGHLVVETWDTHSWPARLLGPKWSTYAPPTVIYCFTKLALRYLFGVDQWSLVSYRPAVKWISDDHGLSLLEHETKKTKLARLLGAVRRSSIRRIDVPYCLGDLRVAIFRRTSAPVVRRDWSDTRDAVTGPVLSPPGPS
jgi:SAM-dependent methyltransferase